jgi:DNA repair exonuclease SbcCD ATPase subunit
MEQGKLNKEKMLARLIEEGYTKSQAKGIVTKTANLRIEEATEKVTTGRIIKTGLLTAATDVLTAALIKLGFAEEFASKAAGPVGIALAAIAAVIGIVITAMNAQAEAEEKRKQQLQEQIDSSNQVIQKLNDTKTAYDEAYESYKQTGTASEDLKNKSVELAEALKIEGAQALANVGAYDELNAKIQQAAINQREYNNALLEQQITDLDKQNSSTTANFDDAIIGDDGYIVGYEVSSVSGKDIIKNKKANTEAIEEEIAAAREQLLYLDNTSESYAQQKQELDELIKSKQEYLAQSKLDENQQKELDAYQQKAENSVNITKDAGLFDNVQSYQQVIDMLKEDDSVQEYLSMLGEDEANA